MGDKHEVPERDVVKKESDAKEKMPSNSNSNGFVQEEPANRSINR